MQVQLTPFEIASIVMVAETVVVVGLLIGWYFGSRRMKFTIHHGAVYSVVLVHLLTVSIWMIPQALLLASSGLFSDPLGNWYQIAHDMIGLLAIGLGSILVLVFITRRGMPLKLLKKTRPLMIVTLVMWILSFGLGIVSYVANRLLG